MGRLFGTDGVRGIANKELTAELAYKIGKAGAYVLAGQLDHKPTIIIGKDTRISGDMLEASLTSTFLANGVDVISLGVVPTPLVTGTTQNLDVDMSIMITASHNPYFDNGFKLINAEGDKFDDDFYAKVEEEIQNHQKNKISSN